MTTPRKIKLVDLLIQRGQFADPEEASRWIMARKVYVGGQPATHAGLLVKPDVIVLVRGRENRYVSRAAAKLECALDQFGISPHGLVVLDAGASVGGFTDCVIQRGAAKVYAVDAGFGQLRGKLASDPRVVNLERTNISDLTQHQLPSLIDLCVVDLSYLSLTKAVPILVRLFVKPVLMICLIKPLFEGVPQEHKNNVQELRGALGRVSSSIQSLGLSLCRLVPSPIAGTSGTIEFLCLVSGVADPIETVDVLIADALNSAKRMHSALIELE